MTEDLRGGWGLRRRLGAMLLVIAALLLANLLLLERLQSSIEEGSTALAQQVELYKLTRRIQVSLDTTQRGGGRSFELFRRSLGEFDAAFARVGNADIERGLRGPGNTELALLVEGLGRDWRSFTAAFRALRAADATTVPAELGDALDRAAIDVQASVIAIYFTVQRERLLQFDSLQKVLWGLFAGDLLVLALIQLWLRRRVVVPIERMTDAARRLAAADFGARVEADAADEIGALGRVLNASAQRVQGLLVDLEQEAAAVRRAEAKFRSLAEHSEFGLAVIQDNQIVYANPRLASLFGYSTDELGRHFDFSRLVHRDDREFVALQLRRRLDHDPELAPFEFRGLTREGQVVDVRAFVSLGDHDGRAAVNCSLADITARKRADAELARLSRAVEQSPSTVVVTNRAGRIEYVNPKFTQLTGYTAAEAIGGTPALVQSGQTPPEIYRQLWSRLLAGEEWRGEILNRKKSGELFWEHMVASPVRDANGEITHFIAVKEDITERKHAEAELRRVNRTLQVLSACNQALVHADSAQDLLDSICRNLVRVGGFPLAYVGLPDDATAQTVRLVACAGPAADYAYRWSDSDRGQGPSGDCIRCGTRSVTRDINGDPGFAKWREQATHYGLASSISLPLRHGQETLGALRIFAGEVDAFTDEEVKLLDELAEDVAYGLVTFRARERLGEQATELMIRQRAIESSRNGVMITRSDRASDNPIIYVNAAFETMTGYGRADVHGRNPRFLIGSLWEQPEVDRLRDALRRGNELAVTLRNVRRDGTQFWNELSLSPVHDGDGHVTHFISTLNDVSDRVRYQQELQHHVTHDTLTGLANRTLLHDRVEQALAHASRSQRKAAILMVDLDRFKLVNESLGPAVGDDILRLVAQRLAGVIRKGDTIARAGSDEFVLVLAELDHCDQAEAIARKVAQTFEAPYEVGGQEIFVSASIGLSVAPDDASTVELLLRNAEVAMLTGKSHGGGGVEAFAQSMGEVARDRIGMETDLRRGIERGEFELFYQPKVRLADGIVVGAEALIRWRHPERGLVPPNDFIPLAEETGLIGAIGDWVVAEALRHLSGWLTGGTPMTKIAVNLSARQFRDHDLVDRVRRMIDASGVGAHALELELTETMLMQRGEATVGTLHALRDTGLSLAIDDFGTGYSSLSYLQRFPIDTLKIDRSFVKDLETSDDSRVLAATILMMARNLGKSVVAEGVETEGQAEILRQAGCEVVQGFLYSRPVPHAEFVALLGRGRLTAQAPAARAPAA